VTAKVYLLARNIASTPGYVDNKTYDMGLAGTIAAPNDAFKRHLFSAMVIAYNQAGLREQ
jgi:type IV pilus assembly protein PilW